MRTIILLLCASLVWAQTPSVYDAAGVSFSALNNADSLPSTGLVGAYSFVGNPIKYPSEFDKSAWTKSGASALQDQAVDPIGGNAADKIIEDSGTNNHTIYQDTVIPAGTYTWSVYAKAAERTWIRSRGYFAVTYFNLQTGAVGTVGSGITPAITPVGAGWYRVSVTKTFVGDSGTTNIQWAPTTGDGVDSYAGDGTSGLYLWGAQLTPGLTPAPYRSPVDASRQTRPGLTELLGKNLVTNGGFDSDTGWTKGTGWTISGGKAVADGTGSGGGAILYRAAGIQPGRIYKCVFEISSFTSGYVLIGLGNSTPLGLQRVAAGTYVEYLVASGTANGNVVIQPGLLLGSIDNVSVQEVLAGPPITLGSSAAADTNDPSLTTAGLSFSTDDFASSTQLTLPEWTAIAVVKPASASADATFLSADNWKFQQFSNSHWRYTHLGAADFDFGTPSTNWFMMSVAKSGTSIAGYENTTKSTSSFAYTPTNRPLNIGRRVDNSGSYFTGSIAYVLIYNRALSDAEIAQTYRVLKNRLAPWGVALP